MKDLLLRALDTAVKRGASYADVRLVETKIQTLAVKDGRVEAVSSDESRGVGVRVARRELLLELSHRAVGGCWSADRGPIRLYGHMPHMPHDT